jgi:nicotinamide-nucleotide amidase
VTPTPIAQEERQLLSLLAEGLDLRGLTLAVAESCTGGLLAATITERPGVSSFFLGGVISYSNQVKIDQLAVPADVLDSKGAVSEETARAMADGVRSRFGADLGVGITGIAGPGGATTGKPVGLVHIAVAAPAGLLARQDVWVGDRSQVRRASVRAALALLLSSVGITP